VLADQKSASVIELEKWSIFCSAKEVTHESKCTKPTLTILLASLPVFTLATILDIEMQLFVGCKESAVVVL
jgi:hypothetical protein